MVPIVPDGATATESVIDGACEPDSEPAHPSRQECAVVRLDDEMDVIVLDRVLDDPEPTVGGCGQCSSDGGEDAARAEAADRVRGPEGDVHGVSGPVRRPYPMWHTRAAPRGWFTAGTRPSAVGRPRWVGWEVRAGTRVEP